MALTRRQRQVLDVIQEFIEHNGYSPSLEEIGSRLELSSVATVHKHVSHLVQKGFVRRAWNQNRSIEIVNQDVGPGCVKLPLSGRIAAGRPLDAVEASETIAVPADMVRETMEAFVLRVQGDSMIEDQIRDGETVVALIDGSEATLKRYYRNGGAVRLEPANSRMEPIVAAAPRVQVQGVVVGLIRKF